jgi:transcriptional regulator with XRE-family HTH domain
MRVEIERVCAEKLRELRRRKGLTLGEAEILSEGRIKAVVLGSYERGTRAISLARLQELSEFYEVPVEYFFCEPSTPSSYEKITFDLRRVKSREDLNESIIGLRRYLSTIVAKRRDFNGEVLTLRHSDVDVISFVAQIATKDLTEYLILNRLLFNKN